MKKNDGGRAFAQSEPIGIASAEEIRRDKKTVKSMMRLLDESIARPEVAGDLQMMARNVSEYDPEWGRQLNKTVRTYTTAWLKSGQGDKACFAVYKKALLFDAREDFDTFMQYIELDRDPDKRFYLPRRHYLLPMVQGYQAVADGKIRLLTISQPKRTGKSQTEINWVIWMAGRYPHKSILMEGTGDDLVNSFYKGCLEYLEKPSEYLYYDVFPGLGIASQNADLKTIDLGQKSRFPTIMCRSIEARQVGLSEASNALVLDDCVEGRDEAHNRTRLDRKWEIISGDVMGRALEGAPIVATGTRYSLYDPIGRIVEFARKQRWAYKSIEIPALDPMTDESNYTYMKEGKEVFTTAFFREQRELLSAEQWESEFQQQPFEAKGLLFDRDKLNYYTHRPKGKPDTIEAFADTAEKGSDYTAVIVLYGYGDEFYVEDVVFDDSPPNVTKPEVARMLYKHKVLQATFESNNAGEYYGRDVNALLEIQHGYSMNLRLKRNTANKQTRIEMASDVILKKFYFKDMSVYEPGSQYAQFIRNLTTYTRQGKVPHDDAPDVCAMAAETKRVMQGSKVEAVDRPYGL